MSEPTDSDRPASAAVVVAAGSSRRLLAGAEIGTPRKPLLVLAGLTLLEHACRAFDRSPCVHEIVVVTHPRDFDVIQQMVAEANLRHPTLTKVTAVVPGGAERIDSVRHGVRAVSQRVDVALVHDAARPLLTRAVVERVAQMAHEFGAAVPGVPVRDTIKTSSTGSHAESTLDRSVLWSAQTPQGFRVDLLRDLLARADADRFHPTDDAALHERYAGPVPIVEGDPTNMKVTTADDLPIASALLALRAEGMGREGRR